MPAVPSILAASLSTVIFLDASKKCSARMEENLPVASLAQALGVVVPEAALCPRHGTVARRILVRAGWQVRRLAMQTAPCSAGRAVESLMARVV